MAVGNRLPDPWATFRFKVEIDGIAEGDAALHFSKCGAISVQGPPDYVQPGGRNGAGDQLPPLTWKWQPLSLERGLAKDGVKLWKWIMDTVSYKNKRIEPHNITVTLFDSQGHEGIVWTFLSAYPTKWSIPVFDGFSNGLAVESIAFAHQGVSVEFSGNSYDATGTQPSAPPPAAKPNGSGSQPSPANPAPKSAPPPSKGKQPPSSGGNGGGTQSSARDSESNAMEESGKSVGSTNGSADSGSASEISESE